MSEKIKCPVCNLLVADRYNKNSDFYFECSECGEFTVTHEAYKDCLEKRELPYEQRLLIRYFFYKKKLMDKDKTATISSEWLGHVIKSDFPSMIEQADNLILYIGGNNPQGIISEQDYSKFCHVTGSRTPAIFAALIEGLCDEGILRRSRGQGLPQQVLTMVGWREFERLTRGNPIGHGAFMAMQFRDEELENVFKTCFVPAVKSTGFNLEKLDDRPETGIIDNILRQRIRQVRFVICDLTHGNHGAYWEAGFAEGLGKPVIYTCKRSVFDGKEGKKPHFDTNHHQTIIWSPDNLKKAEEDLKATIRWSIPETKT